MGSDKNKHKKRKEKITWHSQIGPERSSPTPADRGFAS